MGKDPATSGKKRPIPTAESIGLDLSQPGSILKAVLSLKTTDDNFRDVLSVVSRAEITDSVRKSFHNQEAAFRVLVALYSHKSELVKISSMRLISSLVYQDHINTGMCVKLKCHDAISAIISSPSSTDNAKLESLNALIYLTTLDGWTKKVFSSGEEGIALLEGIVALVAAKNQSLMLLQTSFRLIAQIANDPESRAKIVFLRAVPCLTPHVSDPIADTSRLAFLALAGLSYEDSAREELCTTTFLASAISALGGNDPMRRQLSSLCLSNMTFNPLVHQVILEAGAVQVLCDTSEDNHDPVTQRECLKAIMNLALSDGSHSALYSAGAVMLMCGIMRKTDDGNGVGLIALKGLGNICAKSDQAREQTVACGGMMTLCAMLKSPHDPTRELSCSCLSHLLLGPGEQVDENRLSLLRDMGALSLLVSLLDDQSESVRRMAVRCLVVAGNDQKMREDLITKYGLMVPMLEMLAVDHAPTVHLALWLVQSTARSAANCQVMLEMGGVPLLVNAICKWPGEPRQTGLRALGTLIAFHKNIAQVLMDVGAVGEISRFLGESEETTLRVLIILHEMIKNNTAVKGEMESSGVSTLVSRFTESSNKIISSVSKKIISSLSLSLPAEEERERETALGEREGRERMRGEREREMVERNQGWFVVSLFTGMVRKLLSWVYGR